MEKDERLTGEEFWKVYELLKRDGPYAKYQNPDGWSVRKEEFRAD
jgi:hypothetical protein